MIIDFYLENEEETEITSFNELTSNPFKVGDEVYLDINDLYLTDLSTFREESRKNLIEKMKLLVNVID